MRVRLVCLSLAVLLSAPLGEALAEVADATAFLGSWELVSFDLFPAEGEPVARNMSGRIHYAEGGFMAAQLMPLGRTAADPSASPAERWAASRGYVAYFGRFDVDPAARTVTHHVAGSVNQAWVGTDLVRHYELDGDVLRLSLWNADGRVTGTLTWRRLH